MITLAGMVIVNRGEDKPQAARWVLNGKRFKSGIYTVVIQRGSHTEEPVLVEFGTDNLVVTQVAGGATVTLALTAEDIARAQGPRRPELEMLFYRLRHDELEISGGPFCVLPPSRQVDAPRSVRAR